MPILLRKIGKRKSAKKGKEYSYSPDKHRSDVSWCTERDGFYTQASKCPKEENKGVLKKSKFKTLEKIKNILIKKKQKLCKICKRVSKFCTCNLATVDRTILVLRDLLKDASGNINQSALGSDLMLAASPRLRSSSCTAVNDGTFTDLTVNHINRCMPDLQKYSKYLPVRKIWGPIYPRSFVEDSKMVWLDMQLWYSRYYDLKTKQQTNDDLNSSKSESSLTESPTKNLSFLSDENVIDDADRYTVNQKREERQMRHLLEQRFRLRANAEYIAMVSWQRFYTPLDCRLQLFVSSTDLGDLIHLKTEMLVTCIRGFVQADGDFEVLWVADIKKILPAQMDLTACGHLNPEVALELAFQLSRVKAVLFVSWAASILLRHQGTCFLDTLAVTAGVGRKDLIVLPLGLNPSEMMPTVPRGRPADEQTRARRATPPDPLF